MAATLQPLTWGAFGEMADAVLDVVPTLDDGASFVATGEGEEGIGPHDGVGNEFTGGGLGAEDERAASPLDLDDEYAERAAEPVYPWEPPPTREGASSATPVREEDLDPDRLAPILPLPAAATTFPDSGEIAGATSFCTNDGTEVDAMFAMMKEGRATALYELVQGMVDFGRWHLPPPRIVLVYSDGTREFFTGRGFRREGLCAFEFVNAGLGMSPDDLFLKRSKGGADRLGEHGRGIKVACTYLNAIGCEVRVRTNYKGQAWEASTFLKDSHDGESRVLNVQGAWLREASLETRFTVTLGGSEDCLKLVDALEKLPELFLYTHPDYPRAVAVPLDGSGKAVPLSTVTEETAVYCLAGVVSWPPKIAEKDKPEDKTRYAYVDGLLLTAENHLFPWSFERVGEGEDKSYRPVRRSQDSRFVQGYTNNLVAVALRRKATSEILTKLIAAGVTHGLAADPAIELSGSTSVRVDDLERNQGNPVNQELLRLWRERFGEAMITSDQAVVERTAEQKDPPVIPLPAGLFHWLKNLGVTDANTLAQVTRSTVNTQEEMTVPYAEKPVAEALKELLAEAARTEGNVTVRIEGDGVKVLQVEFKQAWFTGKDITNPSNTGISWARAAFLVARKHELNIDIVSGHGNRWAQISIKPNQWYRNRMEIQIDETKASPPLDEPMLLVTITGDPLQYLDPTLETLSAEAQAGREEKRRERAERLAAQPLVSSEVRSAREKLEEEDRALDSKRDEVRQAAHELETRRYEVEAELEGTRRSQERELRDQRRREEARLAEERRTQERALQQRGWEEEARLASERRDQEAELGRRRREQEAKEWEVEAQRLRNEELAARLARRDQMIDAIGERLSGVAHGIRAGVGTLVSGAATLGMAAAIGWGAKMAFPEVISSVASATGAIVPDFVTAAIIANADEMPDWMRQGIFDQYLHQNGMMSMAVMPLSGGDASELEVLYLALLAEQANGTGEGNGSGQSGDPEEKNEPPEPLAGKFRDSKTGEIRTGYYSISSASAPTRSLLTGRITWMRKGTDFEAVPVQIGVPESSLTEMSLNITGATDVPIFVGEEIIAIDHPAARLLNVSQDPHTHDWRIAGLATGVKVYTAAVEGKHVNDQPPSADEQNSLLDLSLIWLEWKNLLESLRQDGSLSLEQKAAVVHYFWSENFLYVDSAALDEQNKGLSIADAMAKIINTDMGICNTPAGGEAELLRAAGVPARVKTGFLIMEPDSLSPDGIGPHGYVEFWNGSGWVPLEPQQDNSVTVDHKTLKLRVDDPKNLTTRLDPATNAAILMQRHADVIMRFTANPATNVTARYQSLARLDEVRPPVRDPDPSYSWGKAHAETAGIFVAGIAASLLWRRKRKTPDVTTP